LAVNEDTKQLIANEIPQLRRFARALTNETSKADDLVQDCLERAIRKHTSWKKDGSIRAWLFRILFNVFLNDVKKNRRDPALHNIDEVSVSEKPRQEQIFVAKSITDAMQDLPPDQRSAIALTAVEGLSYDEAAHVMGIEVGTLKSRIFRGRYALKELYEGLEAPKLRRVK